MLIEESLTTLPARLLARSRIDDAARAWLHERRTVRGIKATLADYELMLRSPDSPPVRVRPPRARLMRAFGGTPLAEITVDDIRRFLEKMDDPNRPRSSPTPPPRSS